MNEPFYFHCADIRLPEKFVSLLHEAKKDASGALAVLVVKDKAGNRYEIVSARDKQATDRKFIENFRKKFGSVAELIINGFEKRK